MGQETAQGTHRSACPINLTVELIGDRWSLIVVRDIMFGGQRHFRTLLGNSLEGIASNILADRLRRLTEAGLLTRAADPSHKQKAIYSLTEMAITLVPVFATLGAWGRAWLPASPELAIRAKLLQEGGQPLWERFMNDLRAEHLDLSALPRTPGVREELQAAYEAELARQSGPGDRAGG